MIPQPITIEGRSGTIVYMNDAWHPVTPEQASMAKVVFDDGSVAFFFTESDARKYDKSQPRDDKGRWEKVPGESLDDQDNAIVTARLQSLMPTGKIYLGDSGGTSKRLTARVGAKVAEVMTEMRSKGYVLPEDVAVYTTYDHKPSGRTTQFLAKEEIEGHPKGSSWRSMSIDIPAEIPPYADLDKVVNLGFGQNEGQYSVRTMKDIIVHEMGHVQAKRLPTLDTFLTENRQYTTEWVKGAMERVSRYAMTNPDEFVAEAFTRMYRGEKLHPDSMKLYKIWGGPGVVR